jgi:hypothetical protein
VYSDALRQVYNDKGCDARLVGCETETLDHRRFSRDETSRSGIVEYRCEQRKSSDGRCVVLVDVYVHKDGRNQENIVILEVDGREYYRQYDLPCAIGDEL